MSWEAAEEKYSVLVGAKEGFNKSKQGRDVIQLVVNSAPHLGLGKGESQYKIYQPETGLQDTQLSLAKIKEEFNQIDHAKALAKAQQIWEKEFSSSATNVFPCAIL
ncbi:hypothetical protein DAPPUDRAFT_336857 [Daphnia pulex]|uniref:SBNO alpha/beta domain-containing protein n=1 Tax=Daphnia pulex TaxID=6669 RepID=E9I0H4_DAPPU|nr:hypothetical protein DAPPUDRAFT_336857 [Daphnia pulex]|eukprot:EFX62507.1 hypothetical protein DAPPUDRAFT_336857 [Daphnia pulex]